MRARELTAGVPFTGTDLPETKTVAENTAITGITGTSYAAGTVCGTTFVAPTTGSVLIFWGAAVDHNTAGRATLVSIRVGTGSSIGAGTAVQLPDDAIAISNVGVNDLAPGCMHPLDGLVPGDTYNVQTQHRVTVGGNGTVSRRTITIQPLT